MSASRPSLLRRVLRWTGLALLTLVLLLAGVAGWLRWRIGQSVPVTDGVLAVSGLTASVTVERDAAGVPTLRAGSRLDLARALGWLHAQERFFQMDLLRRNAAGELAELFGSAALPADQRVRAHRLRAVARQVVAVADPAERALLEAYVAGVNAGLAALGDRPFEYRLLFLEPRAWIAEDSILVALAMFLDLQASFDDERRRLLLAQKFPAPLLDFLLPRTTPWDAPIAGPAGSDLPFPGPEVFSLRPPPPALRSAALETAPVEAPELATDWEPFPRPEEPDLVLGSNSWAVDRTRTADGRAILANDKHLGLRVPHVWYRAALAWTEGGAPQRAWGVTLPGTPLLVSGSNGHIAWGFTNAEVDTSDWIILEPDPADAARYLTPDGPRAFETVRETFAVRFSEPVTREYRRTIWGPVMGEDAGGRPLALAWIGHQPLAIDLRLDLLATARTLDAALALAPGIGMPAQNIHVADAAGRIGWTLTGRHPRRVGIDGYFPTSWADGTRRWDGLRAADEIPRVTDPEDGQLWSANSLVYTAEPGRTNFGETAFDLGQRAAQIRDALRVRPRLGEKEVFAVALDDRALLHEFWQELLLHVCRSPAAAQRGRLTELAPVVEAWGGRATPESAGFRFVRRFRYEVQALVLAPFSPDQRAFTGRRRDWPSRRWEQPVRRLLAERPDHLLSPRFASWDDLLLAAAENTVETITRDEPGRPLASFTWGEHNTLAMGHPLSRIAPFLSGWLDLPAEALPGAESVPRVQAPGYGASQRMVVSPGREAEGIYHQPGGPSGHPLSPFYRTGHADWAAGRLSPFLPGPVAHTLRLEPVR